MASNEWYKQWFNSFFYHQLYFKRDETEARNFITKMAGWLQIPENAKLLDVACGRGRFSKTLNELGFNVTGIDIAEESIAYANQHANDTLHYYVHDMRLPFWMNYFDYAFNLFTSFGYFKTQREDDNVIRTITKSLKPGGTFVFDYLNVHAASKSLVAQEEKIINGTIYEIKRRQTDKHFIKDITVHHPSFETPPTFTETVSKFYMEDFERMFAKQNLSIVKTFGDYQLNEFDVPSSPRLIIIAQK